jgi:hypothetical protein
MLLDPKNPTVSLILLIAFRRMFGKSPESPNNCMRTEEVTGKLKSGHPCQPYRIVMWFRIELPWDAMPCAVSNLRRIKSWRLRDTRLRHEGERSHAADLP